MNKKYYLIVCFTVSLVCTSCNKRAKEYDYVTETTYIMDTTIINNEKFDWEAFNKKAKGETTYREALEDSTFIDISVSEGTLNYSVSPPDSYFSMEKFYYPSTGTIDCEGLMSIRGGWRSGIWKFYDTSGKLEKTIDYDKPFKFPFEKVLEYCKKDGGILGKGYFEYGDTGIAREVFEGKGIWVIQTPLEKITLDGITGKEIYRIEAPLIY